MKFIFGIHRLRSQNHSNGRSPLFITFLLLSTLWKICDFHCIHVSSPRGVVIDHVHVAGGLMPGNLRTIKNVSRLFKNLGFGNRLPYLANHHHIHAAQEEPVIVTVGPKTRGWFLFKTLIFQYNLITLCYLHIW